MGGRVYLARGRPLPPAMVSRFYYLVHSHVLSHVTVSAAQIPNKSLDNSVLSAKPLACKDKAKNENKLAILKIAVRFAFLFIQRLHCSYVLMNIYSYN